MIAKCIRFVKNRGITALAVKLCERLRWRAASQRYMLGHNKLTDSFIAGRVINEDVLISICVPLYNTNEIYLRQMIDSVISQTYKNWQLCLADASDNDCILPIVNGYNDGRIKYVKLKKNMGISQNSNAAMDIADGEYIAMLDHDDLYDRQALMCFKVEIDKGNELIYSDEANFSSDPNKPDIIHFKPDFARFNLRGNNYICHLLMFKKELAEQTGGFRKEFDGSQDHDLILRLSEKTNKIGHIPLVLYYWRVHKGSVASDISAKPYCIESGRRAVAEHLERLGIKADVLPLGNTAVYKVSYSYDRDYKDFLFFADNVTFPEKSKDLLTEHISVENVAAVCGIITLNGRIVSGGMYYDKGTLNCAYKGVCTKSDGYMQRLNYTQNVSVVDGRFCMVDKGALDAVGGFSGTLTGQDSFTDLCARFERAGYDILLVPSARAEIKNKDNSAVGTLAVKNSETVKYCDGYYRTEIL